MPTTTANVNTGRWSRRGLGLKGMCLFGRSSFHLNNEWHRTRYIETLEKRLERMEELLSSGLLAKVIGTPAMESSHQVEANSRKQRSNAINSESQANLKLGKPLPATSAQASAYSAMTSSPEAKDSPGIEDEPTEEEIERLSDRMYTLMTNKWGESKFIGWSGLLITLSLRLKSSRIVIELLDLLARSY